MFKNTIYILFASLIYISACSTEKKEAFTPLFNGKDFTNWETYIGIPEPSVSVGGIPKDTLGHYTEPIGLNRDPLHVFSIVTEDGKPAVRVSGEVYGALATVKEYENYHFRMQVKWGKRKWPPREDKLRNSGLLYHGTGVYGAGLGVWKNSHECQIMETMFGDSYRMGNTYCSIRAVKPEGGDRYVYTPGGPVIEFGEGKAGGKICSKSIMNEKPAGEWNTVEIICFKDTAIHIINGKVNMIITNSHLEKDGEIIPLTKGNIQLQSEGAEVFFRNMEIRSIDKIPRKYLQ
jgi:hypothetical protein